MTALFRPAFARLSLLLVAAALIVRVVVPSGFMLTPGAGSLPQLVLCAEQGPIAAAMAHEARVMMQAAMVGMHHEAPGKDHAPTADHACAFAVAGAAVDLASLTHPVAPVLPVAFVPALFALVVRPGLGLAAPPPPKTGPPSLR